MCPELVQVDYSNEAAQKVNYAFPYSADFRAQILHETSFDHPIVPSKLESFMSLLDDEPVVVQKILSAEDREGRYTRYFFVGEKTAQRLEQEGVLAPNRRLRRLFQFRKRSQNPPLRRVYHASK